MNLSRCIEGLGELSEEDKKKYDEEDLTFVLGDLEIPWRKALDGGWFMRYYPKDPELLAAIKGLTEVLKPGEGINFVENEPEDLN